MCYLIAKRFDSTGSLALQTAHGQHLAEFKRKLIEKIGYDDIQLVTISRSSAYGEYCLLYTSETLRGLKPDVIVVAAFGQIITKEILEMPRFGCVNVHASLLPAYRGAAPIQWAVINGDKESGVTIMQMDEGIDTGDMMDKVIVPIAEDETGGSLFDKLSEAGAKLCVKAVSYTHLVVLEMQRTS